MNIKPTTSPPRLARRFLKWFCDPDLLEDVEGDLAELYNQRVVQNTVKARCCYLLDVVLLFRPGVIKNFEINHGLIDTTMIKNYLKIAWRNALRYKGYTALNLLGLIVGLVTSMTISLWVRDEVQVDRFHEKGDKIFQLFRNMKQSSGMVRTTFTIPKPAADLMLDQYPEIDELALLSWSMPATFEDNDVSIEYRGFFASPTFLSLFSFPVLEGDPSIALSELNNILISQTVAENLFGSSWSGKAVGSYIRTNDREVKVAGVFEDPPENSTLQFDWLMPADYFVSRNDWVNDWGNGSFRVYFTLKDDRSVEVVANRVLNVINENANENDLAGDEQLILHKFQDYYLYSNFTNGVVDGGRIGYVKILSIVALFILVIAAINFMNLATARSGRRSKEIGLRKVMGAHKAAISVQFLLESILITFLAMIVSIGVVWLILPYFNHIAAKELVLDLTNPAICAYLLCATLIIGLLAGSYPALLLPTFGIIRSLRGAVKQSDVARVTRKVLVVFQFGISVSLIIGITVIYQQLEYVLNKDLGLNKENLIAVEISEELADRWQTLKTEMRKIPNVSSIAFAAGNPLGYNRSTSSASWEGKDPSEGYEINVLLTDDSFVKTTEVELIKGRDFSSQQSDSTNFIINEVAAALMGFEDPIGKRLSFWGIEGRITGVIKNYHMLDMYESIAPLIISCINPSASNVALLRIEGNPGQVLKSTENVMRSMDPSIDFEYEFVDEAYAENYATDFLINRLMKVFAAISIFLSCLGLFGLSAFTADQRAKEIGIRKVHGANTRQLIFLLSKDYSLLMLLAFILAVPCGYYFGQQWLNNFEFRTTINPLLFIVAGCITFIIGALTISLKSYQAATVNPVSSLKDE